MKKIILISTFLFLAASCNSKPVSTDTVKNNNQQVEFGQEFKIQKGQTANFKNSNVTLEVLGFYNQPCPKDTQCYWSGQDIYYKITDGNKVYSHENLGDRTNDGPFTLTVKDSDYSNYANLVLIKSSEADAQSLNAYTSPDKYAFTLKYPNDFSIVDFKAPSKTLKSYIPVCDDTSVVCLSLNAANYQQTNFEAATVSVSVDSLLNTEAKCYNFKVETSETQTSVSDVTINGVTFKSATGGSAGAGHFDKAQVYRNFRNNFCYEIAQNVAETNILNYSDNSGIKAFDENAVWKKLQEVVNTFVFTN